MPLSITIPAAIEERLIKAAVSSGLRKSDLIRAGVYEILRRLENNPEHEIDSVRESAARALLEFSARGFQKPHSPK